MSPKKEYSGYASVILDLALEKPLDYGIPAEFAAIAQPGSRVEVPVRGFLRNGYIYSIKEKSEYPRVQSIKNVLSDSPLISKDLFQLALWMSTYYCTPIRQIFKTILPASVRKDTKHKEQLYVMRAKTKDDLIEMCKEVRNKAPNQAAIIEVMLQVTKGILLTELLEESGASRAAVNALVEKKALVLDIVRIDRSPLVNEEYFKTKHKKLNEQQEESLKKIVCSLDEQKHDTHLLYGITGSGKTEVYLQAIDHALKMGKSAIMLVPEISLTQQTIERFRSRFDVYIAILHHRLSVGERYDEWHKIREGQARIVIGARSAVFSPVKDLGIIIVDEEHEQTYKQGEEAPFYHARDIAVMRGHMSKCPVILGSATPSLESYYNAMNGKYVLSKLSSRADSASLPTVTIVDMKKEFEKTKGYTSFSDALLRGIEKRQKTGEQTILFLNRRGYHTTLICQNCGEAVKCRDCDVAMTFHKSANHLGCHLCGYTLSPPPLNCPACGKGETMKFRGVGTEQIEKALHAILPDVRTIRLDADTTKHKGSHQKLLRDFGSGKADVLIGTQMIAKGLHFPQVTLVGVLNSDPGLNIPDYRASETTFQLITQVAGRAGRGELRGEVIIQTQQPSNKTILLASRQDYESFYKQEISVRDAFDYPPISKMAKVAFSGECPEATCRTAEMYRNSIANLVPKEVEVHPVIPGGYTKVKNRYRFQFLIRGGSIATIRKGIQTTLNQLQLPNGMRINVDINPVSTFF